MDPSWASYTCPVGRTCVTHQAVRTIASPRARVGKWMPPQPGTVLSPTPSSLPRVRRARDRAVPQAAHEAGGARDQGGGERRRPDRFALAIPVSYIPVETSGAYEPGSRTPGARYVVGGKILGWAGCLAPGGMDAAIIRSVLEICSCPGQHALIAARFLGHDVHNSACLRARGHHRNKWSERVRSGDRQKKRRDHGVRFPPAGIGTSFRPQMTPSLYVEFSHLRPSTAGEQCPSR